MIEFAYKIDLSQDERSFESFKAVNLTKAEVGNFVLFLERTKLDMVTREFELGEGGLEVSYENKED